MTDITTDTQPPRWYVTLTWDDWPEGGSYGTVVRAATAEDAETMAKAEMAAAREDGFHDTDEEAAEAAAQMLAAMGDEWHVVDCFLLDSFLAAHLPIEESSHG